MSISSSPTPSEIGKRKRKTDPCNTGIADLRTGVWTEEEEVFSSKVMVEFKAGRLPDVDPKCTIRKLLAQKLHCGGMRISKKFGGQCSGKVPYKNYTKDNTTNAVTDMEELKRLEIDFLVSINAYFLPGENCETSSSSNSSTHSTTGFTTTHTSVVNDSISTETDTAHEQHPAIRRKTLFNPFIHLFPDEMQPAVSSASIIHLDQPIRAMYSNGYPVYEQPNIAFDAFLPSIAQLDINDDCQHGLNKCGTGTDAINADGDGDGDEGEDMAGDDDTQVLHYQDIFRDEESFFDDRHYNFDKNELLEMDA